MKIKIKLLSNNAIIPTKGSEEAAGYDLYSSEDKIIKSRSNILINTDIKIEIPFGYYGNVFNN